MAARAEKLPPTAPRFGTFWNPVAADSRAPRFLVIDTLDYDRVGSTLFVLDTAPTLPSLERNQAGTLVDSTRAATFTVTSAPSIASTSTAAHRGPSCSWIQRAIPAAVRSAGASVVSSATGP